MSLLTRSHQLMMATALGTLCCARAASAQLPPESSELLVDKLFNVAFQAQLGDEFPGTLLGAIATGLSNYPVGTSSGGFTYAFDPTLGLVARDTRSFGPEFSERALTIGARKVSVAFNYQRAKFDRFEGYDVTKLALYSFGDTSGEMSLNLTSHTAATIVQVGVSPRLDIAAVVPIVHVAMDVAVRNRSGNQTSVRRAAAGSASGLGDVVLKAKYNVLRRNGGGVAAAADVRLPTGDEHNFLGSGANRLKLYAIASAEAGAFAPHVNIGFTTGSKGDFDSGSVTEYYLGYLQREANFAGGVDVVAGPKLTILADVIGSTISRQRRFIYYGSDLDWTFNRLTTVFGSTGLKLNIGGRTLLTASVLVPFNGAGLSSHLATTVGFDHVF